MVVVLECSLGSLWHTVSMSIRLSVGRWGWYSSNLTPLSLADMGRCLGAAGTEVCWRLGRKIGGGSVHAMTLLFLQVFRPLFKRGEVKTDKENGTVV